MAKTKAKAKAKEPEPRAKTTGEVLLSQSSIFKLPTDLTLAEILISLLLEKGPLTTRPGDAGGAISFSTLLEIDQYIEKQATKDHPRYILPPGELYKTKAVRKFLNYYACCMDFVDLFVDKLTTSDQFKVRGAPLYVYPLQLIAEHKKYALLCLVISTLTLKKLYAGLRPGDPYFNCYSSTFSNARALFYLCLGLVHKEFLLTSSDVELATLRGKIEDRHFNAVHAALSGGLNDDQPKIKETVEYLWARRWYKGMTLDIVDFKGWKASRRALVQEQYGTTWDKKDHNWPYSEYSDNALRRQLAYCWANEKRLKSKYPPGIFPLLIRDLGWDDTGNYPEKTSIR